MHNNSFIAAVKDEHTYGEEMARIGRPKVIYKGTFVSNQSLLGKVSCFSDQIVSLIVC